MHKPRLLVAMTLSLALAGPVVAATTSTISFEDVGSGPYSLPIAPGYEGMVWTNFFAINKDAFPESGRPYRACPANGGSFCAFNGSGIQATFESEAPFNLVSLWAGIADVSYAETDEFRLLGYTRKGVLKYNVVVDKLTGTTRLVKLNWKGVTKVVMDRVTDSTPPNLFTVDDLVITRK